MDVTTKIDISKKMIACDWQPHSAYQSAQQLKSEEREAVCKREACQ